MPASASRVLGLKVCKTTACPLVISIPDFPFNRFSQLSWKWLYEQAGIQHTEISLSLPPNCWDQRREPPPPPPDSLEVLTLIGLSVGWIV